MHLIYELEIRLDQLIHRLKRFGLSETAALYMIIDVCKARLQKLMR